MTIAQQFESLTFEDWDRLYREGRPPWETGQTSGELIKLLEEGVIPVGRVLELGCGTGANAVCLARKGFEVTAIDSSPTALERARRRGRLENVPVHFILEDVFEFAKKSEPFDLIFDAGFYHFVRRDDLDQLLDLLWRVTQPGSYYVTLAGNADDQSEGGPPRVTEEEIRGELGRILDMVQLRTFRFESPDREEGYLGWSCVMKRPG
ncbi:MAG: class I SAM-dependent methyltransferase [Pirellulales bacterium]|nr:class I SAM-dependent methyltransferase [Pirellulales bacterium]